MFLISLFYIKNLVFDIFSFKKNIYSKIQNVFIDLRIHLLQMFRKKFVNAW